MQTEHPQADFLADMMKIGELYSAKPDTKKEPHSQADFLAEMLEAGELYSSEPVSDRLRWGKLNDAGKIASCLFQTGIKGYKKLYNGDIVREPLHCNLCPECYKMNATKIEEKIKGISEDVKEKLPNGQWRMKIVDEGTEAQSLKRRINRNQGDRHLELASEQKGKSDMYVYVEDEPGKSEEEMTEAYGEPANPEDLDFDKLYKRTREQGKKVSTGKVFRKPATPKKNNEETERVLIPQVVIKDKNRQGEAEDIFEQVNYIQETDNAQEAIRLYLLQFKHIMKELKRANIEVGAVKYTYIHMTEADIVNDWNRNVGKWERMSRFNTLPENSVLEMDIMEDITTRLIFPAKTKEQEPVVN